MHIRLPLKIEQLSAKRNHVGLWLFPGEELSRASTNIHGLLVHCPEGELLSYLKRALREKP